MSDKTPDPSPNETSGSPPTKPTSIKPDEEQVGPSAFTHHERAAPTSAQESLMGLAQTLNSPEEREPPWGRKRRTFAAGEWVAGHFKVVRPLGEGGMGEVFIALDTSLGRRVALKTVKLPSNLPNRRLVRVLKFFRLEAASMAQLNHPNIVMVYQFEKHHTTPVMVLELVEGNSLKAMLAEQGAMAEGRALKLALQLAKALAFAHSKGVIHRDLKPSNVMVTPDETVKVLDFGLALMRQDVLLQAFECSSDELSERLGSAPPSAGTPGYMAPEQSMGLEPLDERVDIWAFGITLFEMLTGLGPRDSGASIKMGVPPWPEACTVSVPTRALVGSCLEMSPALRQTSFEEVATVLERLVEEHRVAPWVARSRRRTNVVERPNAFVGRSAAMEQLTRWGLGPGRSVVTVVGPAGVGKTRLVVQWGLTCVQEDERWQVWMVDLAEATDEQGVLLALSQTFEVALTGKAPIQQMGWVFERKEGLVLVVDNCEQVLEPLRVLLPQWLAQAPDMRLVATSQVPLELDCEQLLRLEPLTVPSRGERGEEASTEAWALFHHRARDSRPGWVCPPDQEAHPTAAAAPPAVLPDL
ncbi:MAG: protein kinase, partial [Myxococcota bacterium]